MRLNTFYYLYETTNMIRRFSYSTTTVLVPALLLACMVLASCSNEDSSGELIPTTTTTMTIAFPLTVTQTVPLAIAPGANGDATFMIDTETGSISGAVVVSGLSGNPTAAHIYVGAVGVAGEIIVALEGSDESTSADGIEETWTVPEGAMLEGAQLASLSAGELYVSVQTAENATGELRGQLRDGEPAGTFTFTFNNKSEHQPLTAPVVLIYEQIVNGNGTSNTDDDIVVTFYSGGGIGYGETVSFVEEGNIAPMVLLLEDLTNFGIVSDFAIAYPDRANPGLLMPGASVSVTLTPDMTKVEAEVISVVSKVVCTNDGFTGIDSLALPTGMDTFTVPIFDTRTELSSTRLDTWVDDCGGIGNSHEGEPDPFFFEPHPGQSGTQIPPNATTSIYDFSAGDEFLEIIVTPN